MWTYAQGMVDLIVEAAKPWLDSWESMLEGEVGSREIVVDEYLRNFSADVISRACFGSSFAKGKEIFSKIRRLQMAMAKPSLLIGVPGARYVGDIHSFSSKIVRSPSNKLNTKKLE